MRRPQVAISFNFDSPDPARPLFKGKRLAYFEESLLQWVMSAGAVPRMIPVAFGALSAADLLDGCDALLLAGGSDISPSHYGEEPINEERKGDPYRDKYEIELFHLAAERHMPIFGVCRGLQLINVALGGSLWQDIHIQKTETLTHRNWEAYDQLTHPIQIEEGGFLHALYPEGGAVNSIHSQAIKELGRDLFVEARAPDGIIEAIALQNRDHYVRAVQWHPEFHHNAPCELLDPAPLLQDFLSQVSL